MNNSDVMFSKPLNEPVKEYLPNSKERESLQAEIRAVESAKPEIPCLIAGKGVHTGDFGACIQPHAHGSELAIYHKAGKAEVDRAIEAAIKAKPGWESLHQIERANVFLKAAELLSQGYRDRLNAVTMLNQSKNVHQAEIDAACELADFWRFNAYYMQRIYEEQPLYSPEGVLNYLEYRPLEGFVFALSPFNFTSIGGNLATAPAIMGNSVVWKPASTAVYAAWVIIEILREAGLPDGVINLIPGPGSEVGGAVLGSKWCAGVHFTGSTGVFRQMWRTMADNIDLYRSYPRIVGETGGKDFIVVHESADLDALIPAIIRGAFEYQGQKCSALSRMYVPEAMWAKIKARLISEIETIHMGPPQEFSNFMNAVIDAGAFEKAKGYIHRATDSQDATVVCGGGCTDDVGFFIEPTVIETTNPRYESMVEEIFAPILTVYPYSCSFDDVMELCDNTGDYALTGGVFAQDRYAIKRGLEKLRNAAGNFYINDKPTGAVVGQQPFGGARASGTNDKAGSMQNLLRWTSARTVKENFNPPTDYRYPFMG